MRIGKIGVAKGRRSLGKLRGKKYEIERGETPSESNHINTLFLCL